MSAQDEKEVRYQVAQITDLPLLPQSIRRMVEIIYDEIASARELESLIRYDQSLSGKILRIANSAYYGFRDQVVSISRAIVTIGYYKARSICVAALLMELFSEQRKLDIEYKEAFWKHAFATARIASEIAKRRPWIRPEDAYILGLLHDLGHVAMAVHLNDHFVSIQHLAKSRKIPVWCAEFQYGLSHAQVGKWIAIRWKLPEIFQRVMEYHHAPEKSPSFEPEVKMIALANILANSSEFPEYMDDPFTLSYCGDMFISEEEWEEYQQRLDEIWSEVDQLWSLLG